MSKRTATRSKLETKFQKLCPLEPVCTFLETGTNDMLVSPSQRVSLLNSAKPQIETCETKVQGKYQGTTIQKHRVLCFSGQSKKVFVNQIFKFDVP